MVLWVTWRTSEFTSFWEMAVPAWDMQAPCQVVTLVMSWSCTYNNPKNDRTGRCDLTWLYFFWGLVAGYVTIYVSMVACAQIRENGTWRLTRAVVQTRQCMHPEYCPSASKSQHSILACHVGRSGVKCNSPGAWWFSDVYVKISGLVITGMFWKFAHLKTFTKMWLWRNQCCKHCKPNDHPAPITNPITLILNTPIYGPNYV